MSGRVGGRLCVGCVGGWRITRGWMLRKKWVGSFSKLVIRLRMSNKSMNGLIS